MGTWPIYKNSIIPDWYDVCPLLMMHKTCSINYGHLADLQKTLPTIDLNKKTFHLIKYLLATFIFVLSFQSVLVMTLVWAKKHHSSWVFFDSIFLINVNYVFTLWNRN